jgi:peptidoglycan/LPS O-acetylase OafA/YrhL
MRDSIKQDTTTPPAFAAGQTRERNSFYRPELDGLRFLAFLGVYLRHTMPFGTDGRHQHLPNLIGNALGMVNIVGQFGVDLFFVLSSYLITELMLRERDRRGSIDVPAFYVRRILRIWPLYLSFLAFAYLLTFFVPGEQLTWYHLLGFLFFSGNWVYMAQPVASIAGPLWSISVEEQFYLAWPWLVRYASAARIAQTALIIMALGMIVRLYLGIHHDYGDWVTKNSFARVDGFAAGALVAVALHNRAPLRQSFSRWAILLGSVALWFAVAESGIDNPTVPTLSLVFGWPMVAVGAAGLLVAVLGDRGLMTAWLRSAPIGYLGRISYGLYVFHELGLLVADKAFPAYSHVPSQWIAHWIVALALTIALAMASYRWLEQPFLLLKQRRFTFVRSGSPVVAGARAA